MFIVALIKLYLVDDIILFELVMLKILLNKKTILFNKIENK